MSPTNVVLARLENRRMILFFRFHEINFRANKQTSLKFVLHLTPISVPCFLKKITRDKKESRRRDNINDIILKSFGRDQNRDLKGFRCATNLLPTKCELMSNRPIDINIK